MNLLKRLLLFILIFSLVLIGLQYFAGRDFTQFSVAVSKYQQKSDLNTLIDDTIIIFKGGTIKEGAGFYAKISDKVIYRWKDELGELHISEVPPKNVNFETVKLTDLKYQVQEGLSEEEINQILNKPKKD